MQVDFGRTADDYGKHRAGFPEAFFERLQKEGVLRSGLRAVDLGTGTGTVARGLARRGCGVTGLDISEPMLETARRLASQEGVTVGFRRGSAERTELPSGAFELVTAGQCWHWFDRAAAAREAMRLLVPGGRLVIAHFDWVLAPGNVVEATEALMEEFNPGDQLPQYRYGHNVGLYPQWFRDVMSAGYVRLESFSFDVEVPYTHESWRGRVRASAKVGGSLPKDQVARFDEAFAALLASRFPQDPLAIPHRVFALMATRP
jgi:ubiquinone/menaquinone biosynthesis C-methylase UbiE